VKKFIRIFSCDVLKLYDIPRLHNFVFNITNGNQYIYIEREKERERENCLLRFYKFH